MENAVNTAKNIGNGHARRNIRACVGMKKRRSAAEAKNVNRWIAAHEVLAGFDVGWLNERRCVRWLIDTLMPLGPVCPRCEYPITRARQLERWYSLGRLKCGRCDSYVTALSGTFLSGAGIDPIEYMIIALLSALGVDDAKVALLLGRHRDTITIWRRKIEAADR